jgi:predicted TIM-barrel enzyme
MNSDDGTDITYPVTVPPRFFGALFVGAPRAPEVLLVCDVHVKHAQPLALQSFAHAVSDLVRRGLADAVIVTGRATGEPPIAAQLEEARVASGGAPVLVGSGLCAENARDLLSSADGAIVGTSLKHGGRVENPVDPARVTALARVFGELRAGA